MWNSNANNGIFTFAGVCPDFFPGSCFCDIMNSFLHLWKSNYNSVNLKWSLFSDSWLYIFMKIYACKIHVCSLYMLKMTGQVLLKVIKFVEGSFYKDEKFCERFIFKRKNFLKSPFLSWKVLRLVLPVLIWNTFVKSSVLR